MKKIVSIVVACIMIIATLSACSNGPTYQFKKANSFNHACERVRVSSYEAGGMPVSMLYNADGFTMYKAEDLTEYEAITKTFNIVKNKTAQEFYPDSLSIPPHTSYFFDENIVLFVYTNATSDYKVLNFKDLRIGTDNYIYIQMEKAENLEYDPAENNGGWFWLIEVNRSELDGIKGFKTILI